MENANLSGEVIQFLLAGSSQYKTNAESGATEGLLGLHAQIRKCDCRQFNRMKVKRFPHTFFLLGIRSSLKLPYGSLFTQCLLPVLYKNVA